MNPLKKTGLIRFCFLNYFTEKDLELKTTNKVNSTLYLMHFKTLEIPLLHKRLNRDVKREKKGHVRYHLIILQ